MGQNVQRIQKRNNSREWGLLLLAIAILLFAGALFYQNHEGSIQVPSQSPVERVDKVLDQINDDLKQSALKKDILQNAVEVESSAAPSVEHYDTSEASAQDETLPILLDQENPGRTVLQDTESPKKNIHRPLTPDQRISAKLQRDAWASEDQKLRESEYVKQFLDNARKKGVNVKLNKNLDVTGYSTFQTEEAVRIPQSTSGGAR